MSSDQPSAGRRYPSTVLFIIGWAMAAFGLLTAISGFGLPFLMFCPLPFLAGAYLVRTKVRIAQAVLILACWFTGLGLVLA